VEKGSGGHGTEDWKDARPGLSVGHYAGDRGDIWFRGPEPDGGRIEAKSFVTRSKAENDVNRSDRKLELELWRWHHNGRHCQPHR
jgi:hypothetical protein